ncbi:hypothetical protein OYC64_010285 [Pagothenia borchgrevinki]|uniref:TTF-type domain-containing protein n=1 Tax=Pagothenia borchgrevinki TaxID=8213 RepID=A0ABD2GV61_PAGBO
MTSVNTTPRFNPNSVKSLIQEPFERRSLADRLQVKELGPDQTDIVIKQQDSEKGKPYVRGLSRSWYTRKAWLAECSHANALFCFPCLVFKTTGTDAAWTTTGVRDMKHLSDKVRKHENTRAYMDNAMKLATRVNIATQLDEGHRIAVRKHNEEVDKNRHILCKIIDCVTFVGRLSWLCVGMTRLTLQWIGGFCFLPGHRVGGAPKDRHHF